MLIAVAIPVNILLRGALRDRLSAQCSDVLMCISKAMGGAQASDELRPELADVMACGFTNQLYERDYALEATREKVLPVR